MIMVVEIWQCVVSGDGFGMKAGGSGFQLLVEGIYDGGGDGFQVVVDEISDGGDSPWVVELVVDFGGKRRWWWNFGGDFVGGAGWWF
ncbi:unnamed protein product, partial [Ilex paraguariensis]